MDRFLILGIGLAVSLIGALLWEDSRDWLVETGEYLISFEWFGDIGDVWEGLSEFSIYGVVFGCLTTILLYFLSQWTLTPFLQYYTATGKIIWGGATYIGTFIIGYMMGVFFENS